MKLLNKIFILIYILNPIVYLTVYSTFTLIKRDNLLIAINEVLPMVAIYYLIISVLSAMFFEKIIQKIKNADEKS
ncbi:hypothetical protein BU586_11995 [Staphylococcus agnetis]|nr:hypothetical protein BU586_11995 [Staphylococcus agnetis]PTH75486.1 hypothetical protein BU579_11775 [Staphylococcus agnetis]